MNDYPEPKLRYAVDPNTFDVVLIYCGYIMYDSFEEARDEALRNINEKREKLWDQYVKVKKLKEEDVE